MSNGLYVALSAQMAMEKRMSTIANNVANMNTPGFRAEEIKFESVMAETGGAKDVAFSSVGESYTSRKAGAVTFTNSPNDVAIEGKAWLSIQTPAGTAYTRDGRIHVSSDGRLTTVNNYPILDPGGTSILVDPDLGPIKIGTDGTITQGINQVGTIGMYEIPAAAKLTRYDNAAVIPDRPATVVQDFNSNVMRQGYVEGSNVDPILEMTRLITVQRAFESAASAISEQETTSVDSIRALGPQ